MSTFEERKKEYLERLSTHMGIVSHLIEKNEDASRRTAKILIDPANEKELDFAESTITANDDMKNLLESALCGNVEKIPTEENVGIKFLVELINKCDEQSKLNSSPEALKEALTEQMQSLNDSKFIAKMLYGLIVGFTTQPLQTAEYIQQNVKLDIEDDIQTAKFEIYMQEAKAAMENATPDPTKSNSSELSEESVTSFKEYVDEFHRLCSEGIKLDMEKENVFAKLFMDLLESLDSDDDEDE